MSGRLPVFLGLTILVALLFLGQPHVGPSGASDRAWARVGAGPHQQGTPTPGPSPCADPYEPDGTWPDAKPVTEPAGQRHSICPAGDVDFARFSACAGCYYDVAASDMPGDVTIRLQLFAPDGATELPFSPAGDPGLPHYSWYCTSSGTYFVKASDLDPEARAPGHTYTLRVSLFAQDTPRPPNLLPGYLPFVLNRMPLDALPPAPTAEPTSTPTATFTPTATPLPSVTPTATDEPSIAVVSGRVALGEEGGPGLPGVRVELWMGSPEEVFITDEEGRYHSREMQLHNETLHLSPSKPGYCFQPEGASVRHYGWPGRSVYVVDFVAVQGPPTPTPTYWDSVYAVAVDTATGDKWFGTYAGVARLRRDGGWQRFTTADGLLSNVTNVITIDAATGDKWFGNGSGVSRLRSDGTWRTYSTADGVGDDPVSAIAIDAATGDTWFGTWDGAIRLRSDGTWRKFTTADGLADNNVRAIASDARTGNLWFGTVGGGADRLAPDGTWRGFTKANGLVSNSVFAIAVDTATGDIWFGTDEGVSRLATDGSWRSYTTGLPCPMIGAAAVDPSKGDKWFGVHGDCGAYRLAGDGTWRTFTTADGLAGNEVWAIAIDGATGDRWFGTLGGISLLTADGRWETLHVPPGQGGH